jgi:hypothetical protein
MAYNTLSGTVVVNQTVAFKENGGNRNSMTRNKVMGQFYGDGQYLDNVARVVANGVNDYIVTVGNTEQDLVGEQNLRFNGSRLYVNGDVTASAVQLNGLPTTGALLNSFLALDSSNNIVLTSSFIGSTTVGQGPTNSIQLHTGSGYISGSENLLFDPSTSELTVVGSTTSSYLNLDSIPQVLNSQDTYLVSIDASGNVFKSNPTPFVGIDHAIRFETNNTVTSSGNFTYNANANLVQLSGDLIVTGTIQANTFDVIHTNVTEMDASGSTNFGNSNDDNHIRTGSFAVMSSSAEQFKIDVNNNVTSISTGVVFNRVSVTSNYTITKSNYIIGVDSTGGSVTVTLPDAGTLSSGQVFVVKDEGGDAFNNNILISASGSQKINNTNTAVLQVPYVSIQLYCDGTSKFFIF